MASTWTVQAVRLTIHMKCMKYTHNYTTLLFLGNRIWREVFSGGVQMVIKEKRKKEI